MHVIFIILLLYKVHAQISEFRYIDLLPEKKKAEFLDNIARRILEEVQEKNVDHTLKSGEVPEAELEKHDAYVRKIMEEESQNLRKAAADNNKTNIELNTTSTNKTDTRSGDDIHYVQSTMRKERHKREGKRRVYTGFGSNEENSEELENKADSDVDIQVNNFKTTNKKYEKTKEFTTLTTDNAEYEETSTQIANLKENDMNSNESEEKLDQYNKSSLQSEINVQENETASQSENIMVATAPSGNITNIDGNDDVEKRIFFANDAIESTNDTIDITTEDTNASHDNIINSSDILLVLNITSSPSTNSRVLMSYNESADINLMQNKDLDKEVVQPAEANQTISFKSKLKELDDSKVIKINVSPATKVPIDKTNSEEILTTDINKQYKIISTEEIAFEEISTIGNHNQETESSSVPNLEEMFTTDSSKQQANPSTEITNVENMFSIENQTTFKTEKELTRVNISIDTTTAKIEVLTTVPLSYKAVNKEAIKELITSEINASTFNIDKIEKPVEGKVQNSLKIAPENKDNGKHWNIHNLADDMIRQNFLDKIYRNQVREKSYWTKPYTENFVNEYKVYEVPPEASSFLKQETVKKSKQLREKSKPHKITKHNPSISREQPYYVPIYNYAPSNAFFDSYNIFGPNTDSDDEKISHIVGEDIANSQDGSDSNTMSKDDDDDGSSNTITKEGAGKMELVHFLSNLVEKIRLGIYKTPKAESEPLKWHLNTAAQSAGLTDSDINSNKYLDITYSDVQNQIQLRGKHNCRSKKKCDRKNETDDDEYFPTKPKYSLDPFHKIREFLSEKNYVSFYPPGKVNEFSIEEETNKTDLTRFMRATNEKNEGNAAQNFVRNIAFDYYFERFRGNDNSKPSKRADNTKIFDFPVIKKILDMTPSDDLIPMVIKLLGKNNTLRNTRRNDDIDAYKTVMGDMLKESNKALDQYNWLETTVDIQSAIQKTLEMITAVKYNNDIHPSDLELLKYLVHLHSTAKELKNDIDGKELRALLLPKSLKRNKGIIKESGLIHRVWLIRMESDTLTIDKQNLKEFEDFIYDLQNALYDLHTATKYIAMVTKFRMQKWLQNLKQLYLDPTQKQLLEVILHIYTSKVFWDIEDAAKKGLVDNYSAYEEENEKEMSRITEDFIFVLELLDEIKLID